MRNFIKAVLIGAALVSLAAGVALAAAILAPLVATAAIIGLVWFILQVLKSEDSDDTPKE